MANKYSPLTNRKLGFARKQLAEMKLSRQQESINIPAASCALEAGLIFLHQAYISLLAEIADAYRHNGEAVTSLSHLKEVLANRDLTPSELNTLTQLETGPSWLSDVIDAQTLLLDVDARDQFRVEPLDSSNSQDNKLAMVDVMAEKTWPEKLELAITEFAQLLEETREGFAEY